MPLKILVVGTGAIGSLYGAKLAQAGAEVSVVCRSDFEVVKKQGIAIKSHWGDFHFTPKKVLRDVRDYNEKADFILVATKVLPEISVVDLVAPALASQTSIILLQNGIHVEKPIATAFPNHHLISIIAFVCVGKTDPGIVHHQDLGRLIVGDFLQGVSQKTLDLISLWKKSGVPCEESQNILLERWKKLVWNAPFNPISVVAGAVNTRQILDNPDTKKLAENVMREVCVLAAADGFELSEDIVKKNIEMTEKMKPYETSMLLDFKAKRKMEVEAILGNAIRFAESKNIATPCMARLYEDISKINNH